MALAYGASTQAVTATFTGPTVSGSDVIGIVQVAQAAVGTVSGVTWGGVSMTRLTPSETRNNHIFYVANPASSASIVVSDTPGNTQNVYSATYLTGANTTPVKAVTGNSVDAAECTATFGTATTSGNGLLYFGFLFGGDVEAATLGAWEVNGSTTGVTVAWTATDSGSGFDAHAGLAYDLDGATGSTDSMSMTPQSGAGADDDLQCVLIELAPSVPAGPSKLVGRDVHYDFANKTVTIESGV